MSKVVFDNNTGSRFTCYSLSDIHAIIWDCLERLGKSEVEILDIFDNEAWEGFGIVIA